MRTTLLGVAFALLLAAAASAGTAYEDHVVALRVTYQAFNEDRPWAKQNPEVRTGAAVVVAGQRLLTEAEMLRDATLIQVEKHGRADWAAAHRVHWDPEVDLALLGVDEPGFFDDLSPARLAASAPTQGSASSVRWRNRQLEVSNSRLARIEVRESPYGTVSHAFLLLNTDFSGGGWAEPVFNDGRVIGLTVSQNRKLANVVPADIIADYLARAADPEGYSGFATIGAVWQFNQDPALAAYLGLEGEPRGVVVRSVPWGSSACGVLRPRDVLLRLGGHDIDAIGNYAHPRYGQLRFDHIAVEGHVPGDVLPARVLRDGREQEVALTLRRYPASARLIPWRRNDEKPPYLVAAGLLLRDLDGRYLLTWGTQWRDRAPARLAILYELERQAQTPERRRILLLSKVLPHAINQGYHRLANLPVRSINGRAVDSIEDAAAAFAAPEGGFHRVEFEPSENTGELVLDAASFADASAEILAAYNIPAAQRLRAVALPDLGPACE